MARNDTDKRKAGGLEVAEPPAAEAQPESLDKVRDILFGGQMRAVETRLQGLEERLRREHEALKSDFASRSSRSTPSSGARPRAWPSG